MRESRRDVPLVQFVVLKRSDKQSGCESRLISEMQKEETAISQLFPSTVLQSLHSAIF